MRIKSNTKIADRGIRGERSGRRVIRGVYWKVRNFLDLGDCD